MKTNPIVSAILVFFTGFWSWAGPSSGGGGYLISCPETVVSPATTELLDLYEGRHSLNFKMAGATGDLKTDYFAAVDRTYTMQGDPDLAEDLKDSIFENLTKFFQSVKYVETETELPQANDLGETSWKPSQCEIRQVAYFDDRSETVYVLKPLWLKLDSMNQAALVHHELFFREMRKSLQKTSEITRKSVAHIYALSGFRPLRAGLPETASEFSASDLRVKGSPIVGSLFAANFYPNVTRLQFTFADKIPLFSMTYADFPKMKWTFKVGVVNGSSIVCILTTPEMNSSYEAPIQGVTLKGYTTRVVAKTGEPIKISFIQDGVVKSEGHLMGGINCNEILK